MSVLAKNDIKKMLDLHPPLLESYIDLKDQLQPNGFDITLKEIGMLQTPGRIGVDNKHRIISSLAYLYFDQIGDLELMPGAYVITFNEIVHLPNNVMALGRPRSSLLRCGVTIENAVWDAGYSGRSQALMVVYNPQGFRVQRNARVLQLIFLQLSGTTDSYDGTYQGENIQI